MSKFEKITSRLALILAVFVVGFAFGRFECMQSIRITNVTDNTIELNQNSRYYIYEYVND